MASASYAQTITKLKIAEVVRSHLFIPLYLAVSQGFTKEQGLDVEIVTALGGDRVGVSSDLGKAEIGLRARKCQFISTTVTALTSPSFSAA